MQLPLNIDWQQILLHALNLVILVGGLYALLFKPVKKFMDQRTENYQKMKADAENAPHRRRAVQQKPRTYSDYVSGETVEQLPDPPQWPQVQQTAEAAKKPKKGIMSRVAKMMEEDEGSEVSGIHALPPRVSKDEAYRPAKNPQKSGKRKR